MKHLALFQFEPDYFSPEVVEHTKEVFKQLKKELPNDIIDYEIRSNCTERDSNADICVEVTLKDSESLSKYLPHPIHQALANEWMAHKVNRITFDWES